MKVLSQIYGGNMRTAQRAHVGAKDVREICV